MKIAVITPCWQTNKAWLLQCLKSVQVQTAPCTHFIVYEGDLSLDLAEFPAVSRITLPRPICDFGNTARAIGSMVAMAEGFDAIAYLDADNWLETNHFQEMVALHEATGAAVCTSARTLYDLDGALLGPCREVDGENFADTSSLFITRAAFALAMVWQRVPLAAASIGSRILWNTIKEKQFVKAHSEIATVNFRTNYLAHYKFFGKTPPPGTKHMIIKMTEDGHFVSAEESFEESGEKAANRFPEFPHESLGIDPLDSNRGDRVGRLDENDEFTAIAEALAQPLKESRSKPLTTSNRVRQRVSLCMIVKNEQDHLAHCLSSVSDFFDEVIVIDTGSTDATKECAHRFRAKVYDFTWVDSFAAARNESLRHATGDWIFWLDADESLDQANATKLRRLLASLPDEENNAYMMCQRSTPDRITGVTAIVDQVRLFRNLPHIEWKYRVHEQIFVELRSHGAKEINTDIAITHSGYENTAIRKGKQRRNERLLRMELKDNSMDGFVFFNLANTAIDDGRLEEARAFLQQSVKYAPAGASYLPKVYSMLTSCSQSLGREKEALEYCRKGKAHFPKAVELWFQEGNIWLARNDLSKAKACFERILELPESRNYVGLDPDVPGCRTHHNLAFICRRQGFQNKAEDQWLLAIKKAPHFEPAWLGLLELYLEQKKATAAEALVKKLDGKAFADSIAPGLKARLILVHGDVAGARAILEQALVRTPKSAWLRMLLADILQRVGNDSEAAERHLRIVLEHTPHEQQARKRLAQLMSHSHGKASLPSPQSVID